MISIKIDYLLRMLGTDNTRLALYAGCSESNFSRLKSGSRTPSRSSSTIKRFCTAVYRYASEKNRLEMLCLVISCKERDEEGVCRVLADWFFDESIEIEGSESRRSDMEGFGEKLDAAMKLAGLSNSRLSRLANVDPSYISRMRSGTRLPKNNPELIDGICEAICSKAADLQRTNELAGLIGIYDESCTVSELSAAMSVWLYDRSSAAGAHAIKQLIDRIDRLPETQLIPLPEFSKVATDEVVRDRTAIYTGSEGLRQAVTRFLVRTVLDGGGELWLYSDRDMSWLSGEFFPAWLSLMKECASHGVKIKIIHNIDRSLAEMITGITSWMPLYMSCSISPYYCTKRSGDRFGTSLFLCPDKAYIKSICIRGREEFGESEYITDPDRLIRAGKELQGMFSDCRPLLRVVHGAIRLTGSYAIINEGSIRICIGESDVCVTRLGDSEMNFIFEHPLMCRAFRAYASSRSSRTGDLPDGA